MMPTAAGAISIPYELGQVDLATEGVPLSVVAEHEVVAAVAGGDPVVVGHGGNGSYWAVAGSCSHYGGPLGEGVFDGDSLRCPWHHARFDVAAGAAVAAPAFDAIAVYETRIEGDRLFVGDPVAPEAPPTPPREPRSVVVVGGGAAGYAAVDELRARGYRGSLTVVSSDRELPYDRPNLSKDYLAGEAPDEWLPLRDEEFYARNEVDVRTGVSAERIDSEQHVVLLEDGEALPYEALLIATGSTPVALPADEAGDAAVHYLRSRADAERIIERARVATSAAVVGASFIGTEVAASLRERGLEVTVVEQDDVPLGRVLGDDLGGVVRSIHEEHGVAFRLGHTVEQITGDSVVLDDGEAIAAQLVVAGIGVRPNVTLAEEAGLAVDDGVSVDAYLRTSRPRIWAAGDIAAWPDPRIDGRARVEHWVVAERQGQVAARNILGFNQPFDEVPFFWSSHYGVRINYVGYAPDWDEARWSGDARQRDALVSYRRGGRVLAVATLGRDQASLRAELALQHSDERALGELVG